MKFPISLLFSFIAALATGPALADDTPTPDGELHITLKNAEYVKVQVNGEDTDNTEFEKGGKVLIIKGLSLSSEHNAVTLIPATDSGLKPAELDVPSKDFKRSIKKRVLYMIANKTVTFDKMSVEPLPDAPVKPQDPGITPPPPKKDDL